MKPCIYRLTSPMHFDNGVHKGCYQPLNKPSPKSTPTLIFQRLPTLIFHLSSRESIFKDGEPIYNNEVLLLPPKLTSSSSMSVRRMKKQNIKPTNTQRAEEGRPCIILELPDHIILEIFCRIPINTLIQCKHVCKAWRRCLSDPDFAKSLFARTPACLFLRHVSTTSYSVNRKRLHHTPPDKHILAKLESLTSPNNMVLELSDGNAVYNLQRTSSHSGAMGSCNGFLCLYRNNRNPDSFIFNISNPITGECMPLPVNPEIGNPTGFGFGYSSISNVYKVVVLTTGKLRSRSRTPCRKLKVMVLTVGSGNWRRIGEVSDTMYGHRDEVFHNGSLHWVFHTKNGHGSLFIRAFDVEKECFKDLSMPRHDFKPSIPQMRVLEGSLSVSDWSGLTLWVMKEYGVNKSWTTKLKIGSNTIGTMRSVKVLKFMEGKVLLLGDSKLWLYTPKTRTLVPVEIDGMPTHHLRFEVDHHIPSFVSLKAIMSTD